MTTAAVPDVDSAFDAALRKDAAVSPPTYDAPPRQQVSADPEAPHGRDEETGEPLIPHGVNKKTGRPNLKAPGPGRGHKADDKPRVTGPGKDAPATGAKPGSGQQAAAGPDYSADLAGLGTSIWMGASACKGGQLPLIKLKVPDLRPYAYVWNEQLPTGVAAWNRAAQQNATVRGWVTKLGGEGSWQWVIGVGIWGANFLAGCQELARKENAELRERATALNDQEMKEFLAAAMAAAEMDLQLQAAAAPPA